MKYDTSVWNIQPGPFGENVTWDFSDVNFNHPSVIVDTVMFLEPDSTPFFPVTMSADYSQSNIAMVRKTEDGSPNNDDFHYYFADNDSLVFLGHWAAGGGTELWEDHFDNSMKELQFPMQYGNAFVDSFERFFFDMSGSDAHYITGANHVTADAYGTMITPDGATLNNVLRVHTKMVATDSNGFFGITNYTLHKYSWYAESKKGFVLTFYMALMDSNIVETAEYQMSNAIATSINERLGGNAFTIHPNPASEIISINSSQPLQTIQIFNCLGQRVRSTDDLKVNHVKLDVSGLVDGIYVIEAIGQNKEANRTKLIISR
jgi:hypothetical protein